MGRATGEVGGGGREGKGRGCPPGPPPSLLLLLLPAACPCPGYNGKAAELRPFELWDRSLFEFPIAERTSPTPSTRGLSRGFSAAAAPGPLHLSPHPHPPQAASAAPRATKTAAAWRAAAAAGRGTPISETPQRRRRPRRSWARPGGCCWTWPSGAPPSGRKSR